MKATRKLELILSLIVMFSLPVSSSEDNKSISASGKNSSGIYKDIEFISQGATLRGRLYLPNDNNQKAPVVIMAHGFTTTINGMTADKYAEEYREAGIAVILYDHINFGISDGEPRQQINFWVQIRGYIDCIEFATKQPEIDTSKIAVWGASLSAREAFIVGSIDKRVKAIVTMIPAFGEGSAPEVVDKSSLSFANKVLQQEKILDLPHTMSEQMPIVSSDQLNTPSALKEITAYRWFIEYGGRFGTNWKNVVSFSTIESPDSMHIGQFTPYLKAPILMIVAENDEMEGANPEISREVFKMIKQPKEWVDIDGGHFGLLYYPSLLFDKSSKAQIDFLNRYLK